MDYYPSRDPDNPHKCIDRVRIVLNHPGVYRILTGKQLHFDFDDQMNSANMIIWLCRIPQITSLLFCCECKYKFIEVIIAADSLRYILHEDLRLILFSHFQGPEEI
jgi:hypothetical protein